MNPNSTNYIKSTGISLGLTAMLFATTCPLKATISYVFNAGDSDLQNGIAVWDTTEGLFIGTYTVISTTSPNIVSASMNTNSFVIDNSIGSSYTESWEASYTTSSSGSGSGGGGSMVTVEAEIEETSWHISDTMGNGFFFVGMGSEFLSGDATYELGSQSQQAVQTNESGTGVSNSFTSGNQGSDWKLTGNGSGSGSMNSFSWRSSGRGSGFSTITSTANSSGIPEPSSTALLGLGYLALLLRRQK